MLKCSLLRKETVRVNSLSNSHTFLLACGIFLERNKAYNREQEMHRMLKTYNFNIVLVFLLALLVSSKRLIGVKYYLNFINILLR